ncbi:energy-coupling factor transporter ATPase [Shimazuella sp. AN120528]|uniref:energy-coupling factor transporter ATPase n=1 Tax=Shimazuella soli TaxID=1892854 RepID=UPI001F0DD29C|nr:energy-coupling factor transporter ATPase [Shimazuella soli]MCH5585968.1 energy-coupling factor transporter ATPase [Shimazuella soli]
MDIHVNDISYVYQKGTPFEEEALSNLSLSIQHGIIQAIIGKTGSGKSTLIGLLSGLLRPSKGSITVGEDKVTATTKKIPFRSKVGVVFQYPEHQLFAETVYKDISYGPTNQGIPAEEIKNRVYHAIDLVGLDESLLEKSPFSLSGGQMRRVALAGVLAMEPSILILDEPTAGLDRIGSEQLLSLIHHLHQQKQVTIILVTHQMDEVARLAGQVLVLEKGQAVFNGSPVELFSERSRLDKLGMEPPSLTKLIDRLNERIHPPIPTSLFELDQLVAHLELRRKVGNNE